MRYCSDDEWEKVDQVMQEMAGQALAAGRTPYVIPESGATVVGAVGAACGTLAAACNWMPKLVPFLI